MVTMLARVFVVVGWLAVCSGAGAQGDWFRDVAAEAGVDFTYRNGMQGEFYFPEIMGGGAALFDYDGDGLLDLYLVQAGAIGPDVAAADREHGDRLYRNRSARNENGEWVVRFEDVTAEAGIDARGYGMGVTVGDYNADGHPDLYVLNFGDNQLWRNNGDGTFTDVTESAGVNDPRWSVSGSFADLDGDGYQELIVVNYADYDLDSHRECRASGSGRPDYCSPSAYPAAGDRLFRNLGDGRFEDVTDAAGMGEVSSHGLGVIAADLDGDGKRDIYVANDGSANFFWLNRGDMRFKDDAMLAGNAVNGDGAAEAGMGVDAADYDHSGAEDILITHLKRETNTLYRNDGQGWFTDVSAASGLGPPSLPYTGFGTRFVDFDLDGWLDVFVANGAVTEEADLAAAGDPFPYHQTNQLFINHGEGQFKDATDRAGAALRRSRASRGAAFGDIDNDGRGDIVVVNTNEAAEILVNRLDERGRWIGLVPMVDGRAASGVRAWRLAEGDRRVLRRSRRDGSYASASDPRIVFGLGEIEADQAFEMEWADGTKETFGDLPVGHYHRINKGSGQ
ncbi:CRTAC1 family protein [Wenzhouxiangella sp. EGI_FJ10305]|uniref:CRTAC1 family protein n=1 Tax=Wenzhouxiangella sp. EGI_FJ10305 TaxID=3243768 RepID=UPI0035D6A3AA